VLRKAGGKLDARLTGSMEKGRSRRGSRGSEVFGEEVEAGEYRTLFDRLPVLVKYLLGEGEEGGEDAQEKPRKKLKM